VTPEILQQLNLPAGTHGVVVTAVDPSSAAAAAGLNRGDVIQEINHKSVATSAQYKQLMSGTNGQPILLLVNSGGVTHYLVVEAH
jgi:serine protease Do